MRVSAVGFLLVSSLAAAAFSACGGGGSSSTNTTTAGTGGGTTATGTGGAGYDAIAVEPATVALSVPLGGSATQAYKVYGVAGGKKTEITDTCSLSAGPAFGSFSGATLTVLPHGGATQVEAACGALTGTSQLTVTLTGSVVTGAGTPANAPALFQAATAGSDPTLAPAVEYPIDGAVAPLNLPPVEIQWAGGKNDLFHVTLASTHVAVDVYTSDLQATLAPADWDALAGTAAGDALTFTVEGLIQAQPATRYASAPAKLTVSRDVIDKTAIYYWASSQGNLMTETFGDTKAPTAVKNDCTSCHSVSRSGRRVGYSRCVGGDCGQLFAGFMRYDTAMDQWVDTVDANGKTIHGSYTTFSPVGNPFPTDDQALAIVTMVDGTLHLYDPDTGVEVPSNLADVASHGPGAPRAALMADWSADGGSVVFASTPHPGQWIDLSDSLIATASYTFTGGQHVFGEPSFIVPQPITLPTGTYGNFFFPSFSRDGKFVIFNAARSGWRNFNNAASAGQRLMLADAKGAWTVDLAAANGPGDLDITWPHWAPGDTQEYLWIVFSSERDYGHEVTAAHTAPACVANGVQQCKQLWIAALDRKKLAGGMPADPSAPPVWLPGQDTAADNISPYWTVPTTSIPH